MLERPPISEFRAAWDSAAPVTTTAPCYPDAAAWLQGRRIEPWEVERRDLARILPDPVRLGRELGGVIPRWLSCGWRSWYRAAHCLVAPVFDERGAAIALRSPSCGELDRRAPVPPLYSGAGVHANARGRALLLGEAIDGVVVIAERLAEVLAWCLRDDVTMFGAWLGGWSSGLAARIPDDAEVILRVESADLAESIRTSLTPRCRVRRAGMAVAA